jgi:hypothetical protein
MWNRKLFSLSYPLFSYITLLHLNKPLIKQPLCEISHYETPSNAFPICGPLGPVVLFRDWEALSDIKTGLSNVSQAMDVPSIF